MKLKCTEHQRRVRTGTNGFVHRTGDRSVCDSKTVGFHSEITPSLNKTLTFDDFLQQPHLKQH